MGADPTILYCVGATKAGTSWLYSFLKDHPEVYLRGVKELHYFDAHNLDQKDWHQSWFKQRRNQALWRLENVDAEELEEASESYEAHRDLARLHASSGLKMSEYKSFLTNGITDERVVGDFTPAYSLLNVDMFRKMARAAKTTRFIYILRDPVARLWSHIRMNAARRAKTAEEMAFRSRRIFNRFVKGQHPGIWARSDYKGTLERLNEALDPGQLLVLFYEELFSGAAIRVICEFLGITTIRADLEQPVHAGPELRMDDAMVAQARGLLADQYTYVASRVDHLPDAWRHNMTGVPA